MAKRRRWGEACARVLQVFDAHPDWSSIDIAEHCGMDSGYVRATLTRNGRKLSTTRGSWSIGTLRRRLAKIAPGSRIVGGKRSEPV
jgi:hypothetical protein